MVTQFLMSPGKPCPSVRTPFRIYSRLSYKAYPLGIMPFEGVCPVREHLKIAEKFRKNQLSGSVHINISQKEVGKWTISGSADSLTVHAFPVTSTFSFFC